LPGVNAQSIQLYVKRFASLNITRNAACGVAFLTDQCFSAKTPTRRAMAHADSCRFYSRLSFLYH
jgi:hypothetical protein